MENGDPDVFALGKHKPNLAAGTAAFAQFLRQKKPVTGNIDWTKYKGTPLTSNNAQISQPPSPTPAPIVISKPPSESDIDIDPSNIPATMEQAPEEDVALSIQSALISASNNQGRSTPGAHGTASGPLPPLVTSASIPDAATSDVASSASAPPSEDPLASAPEGSVTASGKSSPVKEEAVVTMISQAHLVSSSEFMRHALARKPKNYMAKAKNDVDTTELTGMTEDKFTKWPSAATEPPSEPVEEHEAGMVEARPEILTTEVPNQERAASTIDRVTAPLEHQAIPSEESHLNEANSTDFITIAPRSQQSFQKYTNTSSQKNSISQTKPQTNPLTAKPIPSPTTLTQTPVLPTLTAPSHKRETTIIVPSRLRELTGDDIDDEGTNEEEEEEENVPLIPRIKPKRPGKRYTIEKLLWHNMGCRRLLLIELIAAKGKRTVDVGLMVPDHWPF